MYPLTVDDLLPLQEYAGRRREFFESLGRYLDRYRRVRIGPRITLLFENRQTLWFRLHEILRIARLTDQQRVQQELDCYNALLPPPNTLQAAMLIDIEVESRFADELAPWQAFQPFHLHLHIGPVAVASQLVTHRPGDYCIGTAHWVQFPIDTAARTHLANFRQRAYLELTLPEYQHQSPLLSDDIRQSLLEDLGG